MIVHFPVLFIEAKTVIELLPSKPPLLDSALLFHVESG